MSLKLQNIFVNVFVLFETVLFVKKISSTLLKYEWNRVLFSGKLIGHSYDHTVQNFLNITLWLILLFIVSQIQFQSIEKYTTNYISNFYQNFKYGSFSYCMLVFVEVFRPMLLLRASKHLKWLIPSRCHRCQKTSNLRYILPTYMY